MIGICVKRDGIDKCIFQAGIISWNNLAKVMEHEYE